MKLLIKNRFKKKRFLLSINLFFLIGIILISLIAGFLLSDSRITKISIFKPDYSECGELWNVTKEFINEVNYWRAADQECEKELWTCQLILKQIKTGSAKIVPSDEPANTNNTK